MYALVVVFVVSLLAAFPSQPQDSQSELAEIKALLTKLEKRIEEVEKRQLRLEQAIGRSPSQPSEKSVVGSVKDRLHLKSYLHIGQVTCAHALMTISELVEE